MADVSNLKINERSNVELPNLRITKIENESWENFLTENLLIKRQIWELAKLPVLGEVC